MDGQRWKNGENVQNEWARLLGSDEVFLIGKPWDFFGYTMFSQGV
jgi:hypothetical protein